MRKRKRRQSSGIGGQAVLEGIMMKNKDKYAVAVRKPDGKIEVEVNTYQSVVHGSILLKIPFIRGVFNFIDSMILGMKSLNYSADFYEDEDSKETAVDKAFNKISKDNGEKIWTGIVTIFSIALAVAVFMVLPWYLTSLFQGYIRNDSLMAIIEGAIRILIFVMYVLCISFMKDIRRLYRYHGAEHKCINCIEKGRPLTVHNVMRSSKRHKRCGTSFMLLVMLISIVLFFFIRVENPLYKVLLRIALIPVIAGISYEIIRLAGKSDNILIKIISAPGMMLQGLTTREPDESMAEVAIAAVEAVFDWKSYLYDVFGYEVDDSWLVDGEEAEDEEDWKYRAESDGEYEEEPEYEYEDDSEYEVESEEYEPEGEYETGYEPEEGYEAKYESEGEYEPEREYESETEYEPEAGYEPETEYEPEKGVEVKSLSGDNDNIASADEEKKEHETESEDGPGPESEINRNSNNSKADRNNRNNGNNSNNRNNRNNGDGRYNKGTQGNGGNRNNGNNKNNNRNRNNRNKRKKK